MKTQSQAVLAFLPTRGLRLSAVLAIGLGFLAHCAYARDVVLETTDLKSGFEALKTELSTATAAGHYELVYSQNLDEDLEKLERRAAAVLKEFPDHEPLARLRAEFAAFRPRLIPSFCEVSNELKRDLFREMRWKDFIALYEAAMFDKAPVVFNEAGAAYGGWNCRGGVFVNASTKAPLRASEIIALWKKIRSAEVAKARRADIKVIKSSLDRLKDKHFKDSVWQDPGRAAEELNAVMDKMLSGELDDMAQADPESFSGLLSELNDTLSKMPQGAQKNLNPQLQALMKKIKAPPPADREVAESAPDLYSDLRGTISSLLSGEKGRQDQARAMEWLTYRNQKRSLLQKRAQTAFDLISELRVLEGYARKSADFIWKQYFEANKLPGVEAREQALANWLHNADSVIDESGNSNLVRYRELVLAIRAQGDPEKRFTLERELAELFRDRPVIERYYSARLSEEGVDAIARSRRLADYKPRITVTDSVWEAGRKLSNPIHVLPLRKEGRSREGQALYRRMTETLDEIGKGLVEAHLFPELLEKYLQRDYETLMEKAGAGDFQSKEDGGTLEPSYRKLREIHAVLLKIEKSRDPDEVEGLVRLVAGQLGWRDEDEKTRRAVAAYLMRLFREERDAQYKKPPDPRGAQERALALRQARWRAMTAKIETFLQHSQEVGFLNNDEQKKQWRDFQSEFPEAYLSLTAGLSEAELKAELLALEESQPQAFYLLADRLAHLRSSHRWDVFTWENRGAVKGFEAALRDIAARRPPADSAQEPPLARDMKLSLLASLGQAFPHIAETARGRLLAAGQDASIRGALAESGAVAEKYLSSSEEGRRELVRLNGLKVKALAEGDFAVRSTAVLEYFKSLKKAVRESPAYAEGRRLEDELAKSQKEFNDRRAEFSSRLASSEIMTQWQAQVKQRIAGGEVFNEEKAMSALADLLEQDKVREQFKDLAALVQEHRIKSSDLAQQLGEYLMDRPELSKLQSSQDAFSSYLLELSAAGEAPPGAWDLETPRGPVKLETAEKDGKTIALVLEAGDPYLAQRSYFKEKGGIKGYRVTTGDGEEFHSYDGKLVVKTARQGEMTRKVFLINGIPAGTVVEGPDAADPKKRQKAVRHSLPRFKHITELRTGNREQDLAAVELEDLMGMGDGELKQALGRRVQDIAAYMRRRNYLTDMEGLDKQYVEKPEDWWDDPRSNPFPGEMEENNRNPWFFGVKDAEHLYYFLAHRIQQARVRGSSLSLELQKPAPGSSGRSIRLREMGPEGGTLYSVNLDPYSAPSKSQYEGDADVALEVDAAGVGGDGSLQFIEKDGGMVPRGWRMAYRRAVPGKFPAESKLKWVVISTFDHYVSREVYPSFGLGDKYENSVPPWEAFATHWGYQGKSDVWGLDPVGRELSAQPAHAYNGDFRKRDQIDHFFLSMVKETGKGVTGLGKSVWHGAVGTGKLGIGLFADDYWVEGMSHFSESPLSQAADHWMDVAFSDRSLADYDPERWSRQVYRDLSPEHKNLYGGISYEAFKMSADTSKMLYDMGSRQENFFGKAGLYAAGAFIDFGKGTVESMPFMAAGHFTAGFLRTFGASKELAVRGGTAVNQVMGAYFTVEAVRAGAQLPGQYSEFAKNPNDPEKAQAFLSNASGMLVNIMSAAMMKKPAPAETVVSGAAKARAPPPTGWQKVVSKLKFIEGTGMELSPHARNIWGLEMEQFVGGRPKGTTLAMARNQNVLADIAEAALDAKKKGETVKAGELIKSLPEVEGLPARASQKPEAIAQLIQKYMDLPELPEVVAPRTAPGSGAAVYRIRLPLRDGAGKVTGYKDVGVFKVMSERGQNLASDLAGVETLTDMQLQKSSPAKPLGGFRLGKGGDIGYLMEPAPGRDFYSVLEDVSSLTDASQRKSKLDAAAGDFAKLGEALAEMHKAKSSAKADPKLHEFEVSRALEQLEAVRSEIPEALYADMKKMISETGARFKGTDLMGSVTHGDAHPGNFFIDKDGRITVIDMGDIAWSLDGKGQGAKSPALDAGRFVDFMRQSNKNGKIDLSPSEIAAIESAFMDSYKKSMGVSSNALQSHLDFVKLRTQIAGLNSAKGMRGKPGEFSRILEQVKSENRQYANRQGIAEALDKVYEFRQKTGEKPPVDAFVKSLEVDGALPADLNRRGGEIAKRVQKYLGIDEPLTFAEPGTEPTSGAQVFRLLDKRGSTVAVYKVYTKQGKGVGPVMDELTGGGTLKGMDLKESRQVGPQGAWKLGDSGEVGYLMEAAPGGRDFNRWVRDEVLGKTGPARQEALVSAQAYMEKLAKALAEIHKKNRGGKVTESAKKYELDKALGHLDKEIDRTIVRKEGGVLVEEAVSIPPEVKQALRRRLLKAYESFLKADIDGSITHGDMHAGNIFPKDGDLAFIDFDTLMDSVNTSGQGTRSGVLELARFEEFFALSRDRNKIAGLEGAEMRSMFDVLETAYVREMGLQPGVFSAHMEFGKIRNQLIALRYAKSAKEFGQMLDAVKAETAR